MEALTLTVNGKVREVTCDPATPLIYILRNDLDLTGAKLGCGLEQCGACAVMIDGEAAFSCNRPAGEVTDKNIVTVEALSGDETGAAVQQAIIAESAAQCGYCTTGIVVAATSLLKSNAAPDRDDIVAGLENHLCRCGSQARVIAAIDRAAKGLANG